MPTPSLEALQARQYRIRLPSYSEPPPGEDLAPASRAIALLLDYAGMPRGVPPDERWRADDVSDLTCLQLDGLGQIESASLADSARGLGITLALLDSVPQQLSVAPGRQLLKSHGKHHWAGHQVQFRTLANNLVFIRSWLCCDLPVAVAVLEHPDTMSHVKDVWLSEEDTYGWETVYEANVIMLCGFDDDAREYTYWRMDKPIGDPDGVGRIRYAHFSNPNRVLEIVVHDLF